LIYSKNSIKTAFNFI